MRKDFRRGPLLSARANQGPAFILKAALAVTAASCFPKMLHARPGAAEGVGEVGEIGEESPAAKKGAGEKRPKSKNKAEQRRKKKPPSRSESAGAAQAEDHDSSRSPGPRSSPWLPAWPVPSFQVSLSPILDFRFTQTNSQSGGTTRAMTLEGGLAAGLSHIPLLAGSPAVTSSPYAGYALGGTSLVTSTTAAAHETSFQRYQRYWTGIETQLYLGWYRHSLDIARGRYSLISDDQAPATSSLRISQDLGVRLLGWLSLHYSPVFLKAWQDAMARPFLEQEDHWLHARLQSTFLPFLFDFGPGTTRITEHAQDGSGAKLAQGRTDYLLAVSQFHLFWKIGGSVRGKYVTHATSHDLGTHAERRLPEDALNKPTSLALPEDSFYAHGFIGAHDVIYGLGIGLISRMQILNVSRKHDSERKTTKDYGLGLEQAVSF